MGSGGVDAVGDIYRALIHRDVGELVARWRVAGPCEGIIVGSVPAGSSRRSDSVGSTHFKAFGGSGGEVDERPYDSREQADLSANLPAGGGGMLVDYLGARFAELELATVGKGYRDAAGRPGRDAVALVDSGPDRRRERRSAALDRYLTADSGHGSRASLRVGARCREGKDPCQKDAGQEELRRQAWYELMGSHSLLHSVSRHLAHSFTWRECSCQPIWGGLAHSR